MYDVTFQTEKSIKIKIEVGTCPPLNFKTEQKLLLQPYSFMTRCFTLPDLFAGKMHALIYRVWKNRVKGRDWYDFECYVRHNVPLDFTHLGITWFSNFFTMLMSRNFIRYKYEIRNINELFFETKICLPKYI